MKPSVQEETALKKVTIQGERTSTHRYLTKGSHPEYRNFYDSVMKTNSPIQVE